jgi:hypothetical protein
VFQNRDSTYVKDGFEEVASRGDALIAQIRMGMTELRIDEARQQAQKLIEDFDEVIGSPAMTQALEAYHGRIAEMEIGKLLESLETNIGVLRQQHDNLRGVDASVHF